MKRLFSLPFNSGCSMPSALVFAPWTSIPSIPASFVSSIGLGPVASTDADSGKRGSEADDPYLATNRFRDLFTGFLRSGDRTLLDPAA